MIAGALIALMLATAAPVAPGCTLGGADRAWLDRSVRGWLATLHEVVAAPKPAALDAAIFDEACLLTSGSAMRGGARDWRGAPVAGGMVTVAGQALPVGVMSATIGSDGQAILLMSTPSVWAKHHVASAELGLDRLMTAVLIHEGSHVFQMGTYGRQIEALQKAEHLTDADFNDDAIQARFGKDQEFAAAIARETEQFFAAAQAPDRSAALRLARAARQGMLARQARFFVGDQAYQLRAEDLWLTMEGAGQWAGYRWLQLPIARGGGGFSQAVAMAGFGRRGKSWTQLEGLAIALAVERLGPRDWKRRLFGDGRATLLQLLDRGLDQAVARPAKKRAGLRTRIVRS